MRCPPCNGVPVALVILGTVLILVGEPSVAPAQVAPKAVNTRIAETTRVPHDLGTRTTQVTEPTTNVTTTAITGGTRPNGGTNLFHSFDFFTVGSRDIAHFQNDMMLPTTNIIARVIGDGAGLRQASTIDGILRTNNPLNAADSLNFGAANLYLINPAGIMFGQNARLNVGGSANFATADTLRFNSIATLFDAAATPASLGPLHIASVAAFGFTSPRPITITGTANQMAHLAVNQDQNLTFVGGDVTMTGGRLDAPSGAVQIVSVASEGEVVVSQAGQSLDLQVNGSTQLGQITLNSRATVNTNSQQGGGTILVRGGTLKVDNATLQATSQGAANGNSLAHDLLVTKQATFTNNAQVFGRTTAGGDAGSVWLRGLGDQKPAVEISNGSFIDTGAQFAATGKGGSITFNVGNLDFKAGGRINAYTLGAGKAGNIDVTADQIMISAVGAPNNTCCTGIIASTGNNGAGTGAGGVVKVTAKELTIMGAPTAGAQIANNVVGQGPGGALTVDVKGPLSISMGSADPNLATGIFANTFTAQAGAKLMITAGSLELLTRGSIAARTSGTGPSGGATVQVTGYEYKLMENGPTIKVPGDVLIKDGSSIRTDGLAGGNAGMLDLTAEGDISIIGFPTGDNPYAADLTGLVTNANTGQGGKLFVRAQNLTVKDRASIQSQVRGARDGGAITFDLTGTLLVNSGGQVNSSTAGTGNGGPIMIKANSVVVSSPSLERIIVSGNPDISGSGIASQAQANRGAGGSITIKTRILQVLDGGDIDVRTLGPGNAGTIDITAMESVLVSGIKQGAVDFYNSIGVSPDSARSSIASGTESKNLGAATPGLAGAIRITTPHLMVTEGGLLSSRTLTPAAGGSIEAMTDRITLSGDAKIDAASAQNIGVGTGKAGDIVLKAAQSFESDNSTVSTSADLGLGGNIQIATGESARLTNNTLISATSDGPGDAGSITLDGGKVLRAIGSTITGEATQAGGGNVTLIADDLIHLTRTNVTASVQGGPQTIGGNVLFDPQIILLQGSKVIAQATQGTGGTIKLVASTVLADPSSLISASSQSGPQGTVTVQAPIQNLSGAMVPMQQEYMPAMTLLSQRCAARVSEGKISTFVVTLREGLPPEPGGPLPSPLEELDRAVTQAEAQPLLIASVTGTGSLGLIGLPGSVLVSDEPCRR